MSSADDLVAKLIPVAETVRASEELRKMETFMLSVRSDVAFEHVWRVCVEMYPEYAFGLQYLLAALVFQMRVEDGAEGYA